jgi:RNA polymerase sigma-B factor
VTVLRSNDQRLAAESIDDLLRRRAALPPTDPEYDRLRQRAVGAGAPTAVGLARRYADRGEPLADLQQVAMLGLLKAVDGFDPGQGTAFWAYATRTITGELKHYFRDSGWAVQVPRRCKELQRAVNHSRDELIQRLRRLPRVDDFAEHLGTDANEITQALVAESSYSTTPLTAPVPGKGHDAPVDWAGVTERGYDLVDLRESIRPVLTALPRRERAVVAMRFYGELTQSQIAAHVGISQESVSRLLSRTLRRMRRSLRDAR